MKELNSSIIIKDKIYINLNELGSTVTSLCSEFTYRNPEYAEKKRLKFSVKYVDEYLFNYRMDPIDGNHMLVLPRGGLQKVNKFLSENNLDLKKIDIRTTQKEIDCYLKDTILEEQQNKIIDVLYKNEGGLVESSVGSGKTIAILGLISKVKQPTLILVHEHRLSSQWKTEIEKRLTGNFKLGFMNGEKKEEGDIVVALIQTAHKIIDTDPEWFNKFGMIVVDECHKAPSPTFSKLLNNTSAKYRIGVTGTVDRKDGLEIIIHDIIGPTLLKIDAGDVKHRVTKFEFRLINTNIHFEIPTIFRWTGKKREKTLDISKCIGLLTQNKERNNLIISKIIESIDAGYYPLVLSDRIEHNKTMHENMTNLGYKSVLLIGDTRKKTNWSDIREDKNIQCIIANTKIASEALDLPRLSSLFLTCPSSNSPKIKQRIGRIRRFVEGKPVPIVYDFCDNFAFFENDDGNRINILQLLAYKRVKFYKKLQKDYLQEADKQQTVV